MYFYLDKKPDLITDFFYQLEKKQHCKTFPQLSKVAVLKADISGICYRNIDTYRILAVKMEY